MTTPIANLPDLVRLQQIISDNPLGGWDRAWKEKVTPWDAGEVQPPLRYLIEHGRVPLPKSGRAFVPGCGMGYDTVFIASSLGLDTLGADISNTAVESALQFVGNLSSVPAGNVEIKVLDFFEFVVPENERFDLIYDYTFFVAIPPSRRGDWGKKMAELVKPGGYLIALMFPLNQPKDAQGPTYYLEYEHYETALGDGWKKVFDEIPERSLDNHIGRDRLVVWKKN